jgi:hypothetical protein
VARTLTPRKDGSAEASEQDVSTSLSIRMDRGAQRCDCDSDAVGYEVMFG